MKWNVRSFRSTVALISTCSWLGIAHAFTPGGPIKTTSFDKSSEIACQNAKKGAERDAKARCRSEGGVGITMPLGCSTVDVSHAWRGKPMYKATYTLGNVQCNGEDSDAQPATDESPADAEAVAAPRAHRRITYPNGIWYEGPLVNGKKSGRGVMGFPSGSRYEGDFVDDDLTGKGVYVNSDGYHYEGDFVDGVPNGKGASFVPNDSRYEGDFVDAKLDGKGVIVYANGNRYEGNWANNEMNGKGVMVFSNGDRYEGDWAGSKMNGKGVMVYANGDRHDGYWANGKKSGAPGSSNKNEGTGNAANAPALPAVTGSCDSKLNGGWLQGSRSGTYNWIEFNSAKNCFVYETNGSCATNYVYATSGTVLTLTIKARDFCPIRNRTISMSYRISDSGIFLGDDPVPYKKQQ